MATNKQTEANRRNAKRSTGPRSTEGKQRSSRNAVKHAAYAKELYPIRSGPLTENEEQFMARAEDLLMGFEPRDGLEAELAKRATKALMTMQRLDRFESLLVDRAGSLDPFSTRTGCHPQEAEGDLIDAQHLATVVEIDKDEEVPVDAGLEGEGFEFMPEDWEQLARLTRRYCPKPELVVEGLWTDEVEPSTPAEWARAARNIWKHFWPDHADRVRWARGMVIALQINFEVTTAKTHAVLVHQILDRGMEPLERPRAQAWKEFKESFNHLERLRSLRDDTSE